MQKRMTITMDEAVYEGLVRVVGRRKISGFLESLARPHVMTDELADELAEGYKAMGEDEKREHEALEWSEALIWDLQGNPRHEAR
jgi:hypothetical protein